MRINIDDLIIALEASDGEGEWQLDLTDGAVVPLYGDLTDYEPELADAIVNEPERFLPIDPIGSREAFRIMEDFVETLPAGAPADRLAFALGQRRPFRRFKDELFEWPHIREQWFRFHRARMCELAQAWLADNELDATWTDQSA